MNSLKWSREHPEKSSFSNSNAQKLLNSFNAVTSSEMRCHKICKQHFNVPGDHTQFIKNGGCNELINSLSKT